MMENVEDHIKDRDVMSTLGIEKIKNLYTILKVVQGKLNELPNNCEFQEVCGECYLQDNRGSLF